MLEIVGALVISQLRPWPGRGGRCRSRTSTTVLSSSAQRPRRRPCERRRGCGHAGPLAWRGSQQPASQGTPLQCQASFGYILGGPLISETWQPGTLLGSEKIRPGISWHKPKVRESSKRCVFGGFKSFQPSILLSTPRLTSLHFALRIRLCCSRQPAQFTWELRTWLEEVLTQRLHPHGCRVTDQHLRIVKFACSAIFHLPSFRQLKASSKFFKILLGKDKPPLFHFPGLLYLKADNFFTWFQR